MARIGLTAWKTGENSFGASISYMDYLKAFGDVDLLLPWSDINHHLDLIVLPGGPDVNPNRYGQIPDFFTSKPCVDNCILLHGAN